MPNPTLLVDNDVISNFLRSELYSSASIGMDTLFLDGRDLWFTPQVYWEATQKGLGYFGRDQVVAWFTANNSSIANWNEILNFDYSTLNNLTKAQADHLGELSMADLLNNNSTGRQFEARVARMSKMKNCSPD